MSEPRKGIMRSLGEFVGHIARGVMADPAAPAGTRQVVHEQTEEREATTADGRRVILRRTVIDEIETIPKAPLTDSAQEEDRRP